MIAQATTRVDVFRDADAGQATVDRDVYGDEVETPRAAGAAYLADRPASIIEKTRRVYDAADGQFRTVAYLSGRMNGGTDVQTGDILMDLRTGVSYSVTSAVQPMNPVMLPDLRLDLARTT